MRQILQKGYAISLIDMEIAAFPELIKKQTYTKEIILIKDLSFETALVIGKILMEDVFSYLIRQHCKKQQLVDLKIILQTLNDAQWIIEKDHGKNSKKVKIEGRTIPLYWILVKEEA